MPQLDTIFISLIFMWTWLMLSITTKKPSTYLLTMKPKNNWYMKNKQMMTLPWT